MSDISPSGVPEFKNGSVILDAVKPRKLGQPMVCLCWGYANTMRPKPDLKGKWIARLEMTEEDEEWWPRLQKMIEVPPESVVGQP